MFKEGQKVRIKTNIRQGINQGILSSDYSFLDEDMKKYEGMEVTISMDVGKHHHHKKHGYKLKEVSWTWNEDWLEPLELTPLEKIKAESEVF